MNLIIKFGLAFPQQNCLQKGAAETDGQVNLLILLRQLMTLSYFSVAFSHIYTFTCSLSLSHSLCGYLSNISIFVLKLTPFCHANIRCANKFYQDDPIYKLNIRRITVIVEIFSSFKIIEDKLVA